MTSCLQWYGTQTSHWSAPALFYSSLIFSLLAVVNGSQQILLLPETRAEGCYSDRDEDEARSIRDRLRKDEANEVTRRWVFALQAPMMLLTLSVISFLAGLCSVIFSPLAHHLTWNSEAKVSLLCAKSLLGHCYSKKSIQIALVFGTAGILASAIFYSTSMITHSLFRWDIAL